VRERVGVRKEQEKGRPCRWDWKKKKSQLNSPNPGMWNGERKKRGKSEELEKRKL